MTVKWNGVTVKVINSSEGFTLVKFPDGVLDWVKDEALTYEKE